MSAMQYLPKGRLRRPVQLLRHVHQWGVRSEVRRIDVPDLRKRHMFERLCPQCLPEWGVHSAARSDGSNRSDRCDWPDRSHWADGCDRIDGSNRTNGGNGSDGTNWTYGARWSGRDRRTDWTARSGVKHGPLTCTGTRRLENPSGLRMRNGASTSAGQAARFWLETAAA
jgi:hypothetical protein